MKNATFLRVIAFAGAVTIVGGTMLGLGRYSNTKFDSAAAAIAQRYAEPPVEVAIEPGRIDVVGTRLPRTRTAAHGDEAAPRPQS